MVLSSASDIAPTECKRSSDGYISGRTYLFHEVSPKQNSNAIQSVMTDDDIFYIFSKTRCQNIIHISKLFIVQQEIKNEGPLQFQYHITIVELNLKKVLFIN